MNITKLKESNDFLNVLLDNLQSVIFIADENTDIQEVNGSFEDIFSVDKDRITGKKIGNSIGCAFTVDEHQECGETSFCGKCSIRKSFVSALAEKIPTYKKILTRDFYIGDKKVKKHFLYSVKHVEFNNQQMGLFLLDDITVLQENRLELKRLLVTDTLTGIYNRKHIFDILDKEMERARRYENSFSVIMFDIDRFKSINDNYGHQMGDKVLITAAKAIEKSLRNLDVFGRYGGEEFLAVLPSTGTEDAYTCAERVRKNIENLEIPDFEGKLTISSGVAEYNNDECAEILIERADKLLYRAKENGRNRVEK